MPYSISSLARIVTIAVVLVAGTAIADAPRAAESGRLTLALAAPDADANQTCRDGTVSAAGCGKVAERVAAGNECPAASGKYCSDETPYCCGTPGNYYCAVDVNHC